MSESCLSILETIEIMITKYSVRGPYEMSG